MPRLSSHAAAFHFRFWCARRASTPDSTSSAFVENLNGLAAAIAQIPCDDVWLIEQLNARDGSGMYRKLRVMLVDGRVYPLHLAISKNWKVHYFKADMAESTDNRAVDRDFLNDMESSIGARAVAVRSDGSVRRSAPRLWRDRFLR